MEDYPDGTFPGRSRTALTDREGGDEMNCQACGHDWFEHDSPGHGVDMGLCRECFHAPYGGPCFPWELRQ